MIECCELCRWRGKHYTPTINSKKMYEWNNFIKKQISSWLHGNERNIFLALWRWNKYLLLALSKWNKYRSGFMEMKRYLLGFIETKQISYWLYWNETNIFLALLKWNKYLLGLYLIWRVASFFSDSRLLIRQFCRYYISCLLILVHAHLVGYWINWGDMEFREYCLTDYWIQSTIL